jgi:thiamine biosynthesis protein ThiI
MIIVRHGEIYTKSPPVRRQFIAKLASNIKQEIPDAKIVTKRWRILVYPQSEKKAIKKLRQIFGIVSFSTAIETKADLDSIKKATEIFLPKLKNKTFAVRTQRLSKELMESQRINEIMGDFVRKKAKAKVNLDNPQVTLGIEIYDNKAYVFIDRFAGVGGLPLGTAGKMLLLKFKNDALAAWMIRKRGIEVERKVKNPLGVVTGETSIEKFLKLKKKYKVPVYAPLIAFNKKELERLKKKAGFTSFSS